MSARPIQVADSSGPDGLAREEDTEGFAEWCRLTCERWPHLDRNERFGLLLETLRRVPPRCPTEQAQLMVAGLVEEIVGRFLRDATNDAPPRRPPQGISAAATDGDAGDAGRGSWSAPAEVVRPTGHVNQHARLALEVLSARCSDPSLTLSDVADALGVSRWHLSRVLRRTTGFGFRALLARSRVSLAKDLLQNTGLSIKEVAARSGYEHVSNLDRQFRQSSGTTPRQYREGGERRAG